MAEFVGGLHRRAQRVRTRVVRALASKTRQPVPLATQHPHDPRHDLRGARGDTAEQMSRVLRFPSHDEGVHEAFAGVIHRLNRASGRDCEMAVANSLWTQEGAPLRAEFLDRVTRQYGGNVGIVDFQRAEAAARAAITRWVEDQTKQKIRDLGPRGEQDASTRLVLANAVYFKGLWMLPFSGPRHGTSRLPGWPSRRGGPLMHQHDYLRYVQADGFQAVDLDTAAATCRCWCSCRMTRTAFEIWTRGFPRACSATPSRRWVCARSSSSCRGLG